jgi:hypothetical protein
MMKMTKREIGRTLEEDERKDNKERKEWKCGEREEAKKRGLKEGHHAWHILACCLRACAGLRLFCVLFCAEQCWCWRMQVCTPPLMLSSVLFFYMSLKSSLLLA